MIVKASYRLLVPAVGLLTLVIFGANIVSAQATISVEVIGPGNVIGIDGVEVPSSFIVIEDRLIGERPLIDNVLHGQIIDRQVPLVSEQIEFENPVVNESAEPQTGTSSSGIRGALSPSAGDMIKELAQRNASLEQELASLKELVQKTLDANATQEERFAAKTAEAVRDYVEAKTQFANTLKDTAVRTEQIAALATSLRDAYDRLEAERAKSGEATQKVLQASEEFKGQVAKIESETKEAFREMKHAQMESNQAARLLNKQVGELMTQLKLVTGNALQLKKEFTGQVEAVNTKLMAVQGEGATGYENLKTMIERLEDRIKTLENVRPKAKSQKND